MPSCGCPIVLLRRSECQALIATSWTACLLVYAVDLPRCRHSVFLQPLDNLPSDVSWACGAAGAQSCLQPVDYLDSWCVSWLYPAADTQSSSQAQLLLQPLGQLDSQCLLGLWSCRCQVQLPASWAPDSRRVCGTCRAEGDQPSFCGAAGAKPCLQPVGQLASWCAQWTCRAAGVPLSSSHCVTCLVKLWACGAAGTQYCLRPVGSLTPGVCSGLPQL